MAHIRIASRANHALLLPALLAAACVNEDRNSQFISTVIEDADYVADAKTYIELALDDAHVIHNQAVLKYLHDHYISLQPRRKDLVAEWITRSFSLAVPDYKAVEKQLAELNDHLTLRSFLVGYSTTLADLAVWGAICGNKMLMSTVKRSGGNVARWFRFLERSNPWITKACSDLSEPSRLKRSAASAAGGSYEIGLDADYVVTRFPPEPSGYLHVGHAKAALLNDYFAHRRDGLLICRFDDTNPSKENLEFQDAILHDLGLLGITPAKVSYSSDYFQLMYELCQKLISSGKAYTDDTEKETMGVQRRDGIASQNRDMSVEESVAHFEEMKGNSEAGRKWCVRAKISVDDLNKAMRDPVIYRCNPQPHHRTGTTWRIYPTYDFCAPVLDSIEGVVYALRTVEYRDRNAQYAWIQRALQLREVSIYDFSRMNFVQTVLSKRKLSTLVEMGAVSGWDDPRMPTVRGIRRRGLTVPALRDFILKQGPSKNMINLDWSKLWAVNKKFIDPISPRFTAVEKENMVLATVRGLDISVSAADKPKYIKDPSLGSKKVIYSDAICLEQHDAQTFQSNEEITLMNWGNAVVDDIEHDPNTSIVTHITFRLHLEGDVKKTSKKVTWLSRSEAGPSPVPVQLITFGPIITKDKIEKEDDIVPYVNWDSQSCVEAWADCNVADLAEDDVVQLERKGYYRVDRPYKDGNPAVLFCIPSGKSS